MAQRNTEQSRTGIGKLGYWEACYMKQERKNCSSTAAIGNHQPGKMDDDREEPVATWSVGGGWTDLHSIVRWLCSMVL